jgi:hypothetical protein
MCVYECLYYIFFKYTYTMCFNELWKTQNNFKVPNFSIIILSTDDVYVAFCIGGHIPTLKSII